MSARFFRDIFLGAMLMVFALVMSIDTVQAAAVGHAVNVQDAVVSLIDLVFVLLGAAGAWVVAFFGQKYKLSPATQELLDATLDHALAMAKERAIRAGHNIDVPTVKSQVVADAANLALEKAPRAMRKLLTEEKLTELLDKKFQPERGSA